MSMIRSPITAGLADFTVTDEPYIAEPLGEYRTLLTARYKGEAPGYLLGQWDDDPPRPNSISASTGAARWPTARWAMLAAA